MVRRTRTQSAPVKNIATKKVVKVSAPTEVVSKSVERRLKIQKTEEKIKAPIYNLKINLNCVESEHETSDLADTIISLAPKALKTKVLLHIVRYDGKVCDKIIFVRPARMLFNNKKRMDMFIRTLIFKSNVGN